MIIFKLPDLGEGLPEAQIREWYVKVGETIQAEQPMVAVETAKAIVDIPSPLNGTVEKLLGSPGDIIQTGEALIGFIGETTPSESAEKTTPKDQGTVVGAIETSDVALKEEPSSTHIHHIRITPAARVLAKKYALDFNTLASLNELITPEIIEQELKKKIQRKLILEEEVELTQRPVTMLPKIKTLAEKDIDLTPIQHSMFDHMVESHLEVVAATVHEEIDINAWYQKDDLTIRLIRALVAACQAEPILNASLDSRQLRFRLNSKINLGLAIDTANGLYVPVIRNAANLDDQQLRQQINLFKEQAEQKKINQKDLHGATITLSNYGNIAGRFATPIIMPPQVAILGAGQYRPQVVAVDDSIAIHRVLPISLSFDHRLITGGEAARFLKVLVLELSKAQ